MAERISTRATALIAALLLVLGMAALGAGSAGDGEVSLVRAAERSEPDQAKPNGTGNACPDASPNAGGDPACGNQDDAEGKQGDAEGKQGDEGDGHAGEGNGNACPESSPNAGGEPPCGHADGEGEGTEENGENGKGDTTCPPASPNAGGEPPCGDGDDDGEADDRNGENGDGENGNGENGNGGDVEAAACPEGGLTLELPGEPLFLVCIALGPDEDPAAAEDYCGEIESGAFAVELPGEPLLYACVVLGPDEENGEEDEASRLLF
jgi:hypothetical protein